MGNLAWSVPNFPKEEGEQRHSTLLVIFTSLQKGNKSALAKCHLSWLSFNIINFKEVSRWSRRRNY